jgi:hypothetical protein
MHKPGFWFLFLKDWPFGSVLKSLDFGFVFTKLSVTLALPTLEVHL